MKKSQVLGLAFVLYASFTPQINAQESVKQTKESWLKSIGQKTVKVLEDIITTGADYVDEKLRTSMLEDEIEQKLSYEIEDNQTARLINYLGLKQGKTAYLTSDSKSKSSAKVYFQYNLDNLAFAQEYVFSKSNGNIQNIISKGNSWIDLNNKGYSKEEGTKVLHLYSKIITEWEKRKSSYNSQNPDEKFIYERKPVSVSGDRATVDFTFYILDKLGNKKENKTNTVTEEYKFLEGNWHFTGTEYFLSEKNAKQKDTGFFQDFLSTMKSGYEKAKRVWRGE